MQSMKTFFKRLFIFILLAGIAAGGYFTYLYFSGSGGAKNQYAFVPEDFVMLIESEKPINNWRDLSSSNMWQTLKKAEYFKDITASTNSLDSLLTQNKKIADMVKVGKMLVSTHIIAKDNYDFLIILDLHDNGKIANFKGFLPILFKQAGYSVTNEKAYNYDIYNLYDAKEHETLSVSLIGNVLLASYTKNLVKKAIEHSENGNILDIKTFKTVHETLATDGPYALMVNYAQMDAFLRVFSPAPSEMLLGLNQSLTYTGMTLKTAGEKVELDGYTLPIDSAASYINAFRAAGTGKINAASILPKTTVMFTSLGFSDFSQFWAEIQKVYQKGNQKEYDDLMKNKKQFESYLKISLEKEFFAWMNEEVVAAVVAVPQNEGSIKYKNFAMLHFAKNNYEQVKGRLDFVEKQIRRKTPLKFETETYKGYDIHFLEMKGFFKLFFKKLFSKIEQPHYIIIDDYVIFSNEVSDLQYIIDEYLEDRLLEKDNEYQAFFHNFSAESNIFTYIRNEYAYEYIRSSLDIGSKNSLDKNQISFRSFSHIGLQIYPESGMLRNKIRADIKEWKPENKAIEVPIKVIQDSLSSDSSNIL